MTLHWWMHWFWVTAQLAGLLLASPLPSTTQDPIIEQKVDTSRSGVSIMEARIEQVSRIDPRVMGNESLGATSSGTGGREEAEDGGTEGLSHGSRGIPESGSFRVAKAISSYDAPTKTNTALANNNNNNDHRQVVVVDEAGTESTTRRVASIIETPSDTENVHGARQAPNSFIKRDDNPNLARPESSSISQQPDSQITWLLTTSKTPERRKKKNDNLTSRSADILRNFSSKSHDQDNKDLTVLPLRFEGTRIKLVVNSTRTITTGNRLNFSTRTFNGSEDIEIDQELAEPRLAATAASILQAGISESTRLSRARNAFSSDFQRDHREEDRASDINVSQVLLEANESVNREIETSSSPSVVDIAAITGSCLATIVLLSTMASLGFIMYRRKYLNPPQTLNSDKCSNPDSSGYIDDSTIRDNSEEMYSLDNDSFLNSLEAMTIQNYWTDSVKHTKL